MNITCKHCHDVLTIDRDVFIDSTGGDACMNDDGDQVDHEPSQTEEAMTDRILNIAGMTERTMRLYRHWRVLANRGYGQTTSVDALQKIDTKIARAKARYESALAQDKAIR